MVGCSDSGKKSDLTRYESTFFDSFDTIIQMVYYAESEEEAEAIETYAHDRFLELHKQFTKYDTYEGINNVVTINNSAGKEPVPVGEELFNLIEFCINNYKQYSPKTNIAIGKLTELWHQYREGYEIGTEIEGETEDIQSSSELPPDDLLHEASEHMDIDKVKLNKETREVYLEDEQMSLDLGAVAKGYATELVAQELMEQGLESGIISAGGNVKVIGSPPEEEKESFTIGIQNPDAVLEQNTADNIFEVLHINNSSVVTSGDYQRFYIVNGKRYNHLIDTETLYPADYYRSVTIITEDSGLADFLSTAAFCLPYEESFKLIDELDGVEGYWIHNDGSCTYTDGVSSYLGSEATENGAE